MLVLSITGSLLAFDQFFILTRGGPDNSTVSMVMVIYREAFTRFDLGSAAAISVCCWSCWWCSTSLQLRVLGRRAMKPSRAGRRGYYATAPRSPSCSCSRWCGAATRRVEGEPGSGQESGFGFGNYTRDGATTARASATYLLNTADRVAD